MYEKLIENPVELIGIIDNALVFEDENDDIFYFVAVSEDVEFYVIGDTFDGDEMELIAVDEAPDEIGAKIIPFIEGE